MTAKKARQEARRVERAADEKATKQDPNKGGAQASKNGVEVSKKDGANLAGMTDPLGDAMEFLWSSLRPSACSKSTISQWYPWLLLPMRNVQQVIVNGPDHLGSVRRRSSATM
ncbi:uncharacterized protein B0H64DRAFT_378693 [Chaetomium fimeti]|uniref:Uncharacterized protein n=1 Tax=Chaetomium fimeti TaxID=1854472 RepID=A0AAE0H5W3_9PEZI|nr:hypothetical protein B0H64DRAFT_378693 [Chaetomium fimeti]